jgi:hypothetical protein
MLNLLKKILDIGKKKLNVFINMKSRASENQSKARH